ncbi:hypothetical protein J4458_02725, partial [Candidatus Woesearchaeota archaeon]|nr:hypothetical protein [Candidatus Woesearchaeota archaeon]
MKQLYKKWMLELMAVYLVLTISLIGFYYAKPTITAFITAGRQFSYNDTLNLAVNESGSYDWIMQNPGLLKSLKVSGLIENKGSAKVYLEIGNSSYLVFDSSQLNEKAVLDKITGFAAAEDKGKGKNKEPEWKSKIDSFIVNGTLILDLNDYFEDKDGDILAYSFKEIEDLAITLESSILAITNENNLDEKRTLEITASDNESSKKKDVDLILIKNIAINETVLNETLANETINITPIINETLNITPIINITNQTINITPIINKTTENITTNKSIEITLEYETGTNYDVDDNGIESTTGIVDLIVKNTKFNWDANQEKLCTLWDTYSAENKESTLVCYGSQNCCSFVGLTPTRANWSETFYSYYGLYGATFDNIISAQVINVDYNLSIENPYSDIVYSSWKNLSAVYYEGLIKFDNICADTCTLFDFLNETSYKLVFEINDTSLTIEMMNYIVENDAENNAPVLIQNISNITITKNKNYTIDLNEYFADADGDLLIFNYYKNIENISVSIENNIAAIIPDKDFIGSKYMFFTANDSFETAVSNVFKVDVAESKFLTAEIQIGKPVKKVERIIVENLTQKEDIKISLPLAASNLSIKNIANNTAEIIADEKIEIIKENAVKSKDKFEKEKELEKLKRKLSLLKEAKGKNAKIIIDESEFEHYDVDGEISEVENETLLLEQELKSEDGNLITGSVIEEIPFVGNETNETILIINDTSILSEGSEIEIEYYTEAPVAIEEETLTGKTIKITSETHYENILAYASIKESKQENIKLYWIVN